MVMRKFYIIIISLLSFFTITIVKADTLPDFNLVVTENENFDLQMFNDRTYLEFFNEVIAYDSEYYDILITPTVLNSDSTSYRINLALIPKGLPFPLSTLAYSQSGSDFFMSYTFPLSSYKYYDISPSTSLSINNSTAYNNFKNCYLNGVCTSYNQGNLSSSFYRGRNYNVNNSYDNELAQRGYVIYSSLPIPITYSSNFSAKFSSFSVNNTLIDDNGYIPTYYDVIYGTPQPDTSPDYTATIFDEPYLTDLGTFHIGGLTENQFKNFSLTSTFVPSYTSYNDYRLNTLVYKYGRINENGYYRYELITDCTSVGSFSTISTGVSFSFTNNTCTTDLSNYDNFYITIWTYDDTDTIDLSLVGEPVTTISGGYLYRGVAFDFGIYEYFTSLPSNFSYLISSNALSSKVYLTSPDNTITTSVYYLTDMTFVISYSSFAGSFYKSFVIGKSNNYGLQVGNYYESNSSSNNNTYTLGLFIDENTIVSYSNNNLYNYYDNGTITTTSSEGFGLPSTITPDSSGYNINYYFTKINDFMFSLENDINSFSSLTQEFYNSAPTFMQVFIYICFILLCCYFVYLMIRK